MAVLRAEGCAVAAAVPAAQLARLGLPALIAAAVLAVLVLATGWWILADDGRAARLAQILRACHRSPVPEPPEVGPAAAGRPRRRLWWRE
jgi:hypothetical protein